MQYTNLCPLMNRPPNAICLTPQFAFPLAAVPFPAFPLAAGVAVGGAENFS
jgi:hypothetical protein